MEEKSEKKNNIIMFGMIGKSHPQSSTLKMSNACILSDERICMSVFLKKYNGKILYSFVE